GKGMRRTGCACNALQLGSAPWIHSRPSASSMHARSEDSRAESCREVMIGLVAPCNAWKANVDNTFPGPTSNSTGDDSMASKVLSPSAKRTVSRACLAQYWVEVASDSLIHVPVTHE